MGRNGEEDKSLFRLAPWLLPMCCNHRLGQIIGKLCSSYCGTFIIWKMLFKCRIEFTYTSRLRVLPRTAPQNLNSIFIIGSEEKIINLGVRYFLFSRGCNFKDHYFCICASFIIIIITTIWRLYLKTLLRLYLKVIRNIKYAYAVFKEHGMQICHSLLIRNGWKISIFEWNFLLENGMLLY